jgi:glycosyltransferase involved in cell wall biosynthesis
MDVQVDIDNFYSLDSTDAALGNDVFTNYLHLDQIEPKIINPLTWLRVFTFFFSMDRILLTLIAFSDFKNNRQLIKRAFKNHLIQDQLRQTLNSYDIIHLHFVSAKALLFFNIKGITAKLICSFWGSDLFRTQGLFNYYIQSKVLKKFDIIQIGPDVEYAQIFFYKFGFDYHNKIRYYKIWNSDEVLESIKNNNSPAVTGKFRKDCNIPLDKLIIQVCHNGDKNNNHLHIIKSLSELDGDSKVKLFLILPFTYLNKDKDYYHQVINSLDRSGIEYKIIDKFLTVDEIGALRNSVDVFIHMPVSDGLNNTLREYVFAQKFIITGSWLPYNILRRQGAFYEIVEDFKAVKDKLCHILNNFEELKPRLNKNRNVIENHHTEHACVDDWVDTYHELLI